MPPRAKKTKKTNLKQTAFTRFSFIVALLVLWMGGIAVRLVHLQINQHESLSEKAVRQRQDVKRIKSPRGTIYDRNGRALAMSLTVKTLAADPTKIDDIRSAAKAIAKVLGAKESDLVRRLNVAKNDGKRFLPLAKGLDEEAVQKINKALEDSAINKADLPRFAGLSWREDQKRSYPYEKLAAHVVGFSNAEGVGQAGIEQSQNEILFGAVIKRLQERDRLGRVYDETVYEKEPPKDVALTIGTSTQYHAEQALEKAVKASSAKSGMAIVIAHKTGEILAMANYPTFDPNKLNEITPANLKNEAIQSIYSPGSVFKLITYGAALERNLISPEAIIDSGNGSIEVAKHRFTDSHPIGQATYSKALAVSSNVCAIKTAMKVGKEGFHDTVKMMGFGKRLGIELPAETGGIVRAPERWYGDSLASMSIGYEIGVTALQMTTAFATIANDGVRVQPHIIKEIRQSNEQKVPKEQPARTRVVSTETARDLQSMLREVVLTGTGKAARLNGYSSAGKTGTAWKFDEKLKRVNSAKYISSFIGFAPAENPEITIAVIIDEPRVGGRNGGQVAGPVFREIAEQVLPEMGIKPEGFIENDNVVADIPETVGNGDGANASKSILVDDSKLDEIFATANPEPDNIHDFQAEPSGGDSEVINKKDKPKSSLKKPSMDTRSTEKIPPPSQPKKPDGKKAAVIRKKEKT